MEVEKEFSDFPLWSRKISPRTEWYEGGSGGAAPCYPALSLVGFHYLSYISKSHRMQPPPHATGKTEFSETENMLERFTFIGIKHSHGRTDLGSDTYLMQKVLVDHSS